MKNVLILIAIFATLHPLYATNTNTNTVFGSTDLENDTVPPPPPEDPHGLVEIALENDTVPPPPPEDPHGWQTSEETALENDTVPPPPPEDPHGL